jgi:hypothetical protein
MLFLRNFQAQRPDSQYFLLKEEISQINAQVAIRKQRPGITARRVSGRGHDVAYALVKNSPYKSSCYTHRLTRILGHSTNVQGHRIALNRDILNQHFTPHEVTKENIMFFNNIKNILRRSSPQQLPGPLRR